MLTKFFRSDRPIVLAILFFISFSAWVIAFFMEENALNVESTILLQPLINQLNSVKLLGVLLAFGFHFITAILLNSVANRFNLADKKSYAVAFMYLLLSIATMEGYSLTTGCIVNLLLVVLLFRLFQLPSSNNSKSIIFDSSFLVGVLAIINPVNIFLILVVWVGITSFKSAYFRDWIISLIGFFLPGLYLTVGFYFFDSLYLIDGLKLYIAPIAIAESNYILILGILLLLIPALVVFVGNRGQKTAVSRKMSNLILLLFAIMAISSVFLNRDNLIVLSSLVPISIIVGVFFIQVKKVIIAESILLLFMVVSCYYHYINW
ncbi:MAG: hypothetical protein JKY53_04680 [Flavobacteriales bacterium]|nr:hypothetical protein [Flavobacteriales bacterium]